jgi:protein gp37
LWALIKAIGQFGGSCYAGNYQETRLSKAMPALYAPNFTEVRLIPGRMAKAAAWSDLTGTDRPDKPWLNGMPRMIFVGDMGDVLSNAVPFEYLRDEIVDVAASPKGRRHIWLLLTKRGGRLADFSKWLKGQRESWPPNLWAGVSVTSAATEKRVTGLLEVPTTRFVSYEPLLEAVKLPPGFNGERRMGDGFLHHWAQPFIDWAIIGGESDQKEHEGRPFDVRWAISLIGQCQTDNVPAFVKQLGSQPYDSQIRIAIDAPASHACALSLQDSHGGDWSEWPSQLRVRDVPKAKALGCVPC